MWGLYGIGRRGGRGVEGADRFGRRSIGNLAFRGVDDDGMRVIGAARGDGGAVDRAIVGDFVISSGIRAVSSGRGGDVGRWAVNWARVRVTTSVVAALSRVGLIPDSVLADKAGDESLRTILARIRPTGVEGPASTGSASFLANTLGPGESGRVEDDAETLERRDRTEGVETNDGREGGCAMDEGSTLARGRGWVGDAVVASGIWAVTCVSVDRG